MRRFANGNYITLRKFVWPAEKKDAEQQGTDEGLVTFNLAPLLPDADLGQLVKGVFVDTETTGLGPNAEVVEVALAPFLFHKVTGELHWVGDAYVGMQEPSGDIPAEATAVNGITIDMVKGKKIDWAHVRSMLAAANMIVAHNAKFDRPLVETALRTAGQALTETPWACSMAQVEWKQTLGVPSNSLEVICAWLGFWYEAHRAEVDIGAGIHALQQSGNLHMLYKRLHDKVYEVQARGAPFEANQAVLKPRKYSWNGEGKFWSIRYKTEEDAKAEVEFLKESVYAAYKLPNRAVIVVVEPSKG